MSSACLQKIKKKKANETSRADEDRKNRKAARVVEVRNEGRKLKVKSGKDQKKP